MPLFPPSEAEKLSMIFPSVGQRQPVMAVLPDAKLLDVELGAVTGAVVATTAPDVGNIRLPFDGNIFPTFCLPEFSEYSLFAWESIPALIIFVFPDGFWTVFAPLTAAPPPLFTSIPPLLIVVPLPVSGAVPLLTCKV